MAENILRRLRFDNDTIARVCQLILGHDDNPPVTGKTIRRAVVRLGREAFPDIFAVKRADILAQSRYLREEKLAYVAQYEVCYQDILRKEECLSLKDLAVNGADLIAEGIKPGPGLGAALQELFELVLEEPENNTKEYLLGKVRARTR